MPSFDEIAEFVSDYTCVERSRLTEATTLLGDLGLNGIDNDIFLRKYSERFNVDLSGYLWYFHTYEEFHSIGALFFRPPNKRVKNIPVTIGMLHKFAQAGRWNVVYPDHRIPSVRLDVVLNNTIIVCLLLLIFIALVVAAVRDSQ